MAHCNVSTKVAYFLAGFGIGAAVALLFAPQSGEETRKLIADKAEEGKEYIAGKGRELRRQADELIDHGKQLVSKQKDRLADVLEAGKQAARETFAR